MCCFTWGVVLYQVLFHIMCCSIACVVLCHVLFYVMCCSTLVLVLQPVLFYTKWCFAPCVVLCHGLFYIMGCSLCCVVPHHGFFYIRCCFYHVLFNMICFTPCVLAWRVVGIMLSFTLHVVTSCVVCFIYWLTLYFFLIVFFSCTSSVVLYYTFSIESPHRWFLPSFRLGLSMHILHRNNNPHLIPSLTYDSHSPHLLHYVFH